MKKCNKCSKYKENSTEYFYVRSNGKLDTICKECVLLRNRNTFQRENYKDLNKSRSKAIRELILSTKTNPCIDCKKIFPYYVMDFDHKHGRKKMNISSMVYQSRSVELTKQEIAKCELVCANCHRKRTFRNVKSHQIIKPQGKPTYIFVSSEPGENKKRCSSCYSWKLTNEFYVKRRKLQKGLRPNYTGYGSTCKDCSKIYFKFYRKYLRQIKRKKLRDMVKIFKQKPCIDCNKTYPHYVMDFDHKYDKKYNISSLMIKSRKILLQEIVKCEVVCANCHRKRTFRPP